MTKKEIITYNYLALLFVKSVGNVPVVGSAEEHNPSISREENPDAIKVIISAKANPGYIYSASTGHPPSI